MYNESNLNKKIIWNAISSYFGLAFLFLLPNKNSNINNPFVKNHTKTAFFIHILFLITYIIFIHFGIWNNISFIWHSLSHILASTFFIILFIWLLYWIYEANKWNTFEISDIISFSKSDKLVNIKNANLNEKWVLTIILSYIPFIWYIIYWKYFNYKSPIILNNVKLNLISSLIIVLLYIFWLSNIVNLLILVYIIFIVFASILLISNNKLINIKLEMIPTIEELEIYTKSFLKYIKNYFWNFKWWKETFENTKKETIEKNKTEAQELNKKDDIKLQNYIIYIPIINIITIFFIKSKYQNHIINWIIITALFIILGVIFWINNNYYLLLLFPIFFWIWYLKRVEYKLPFLFSLYKVLENIFKKLFFFLKKVKEKHKEEHNVSYKVSENKRDS